MVLRMDFHGGFRKSRGRARAMGVRSGWYMMLNRRVLNMKIVSFIH